MSDDRRYQSHLFNTIRHHTRTLSEQWHRRVRQVKVATVWGVQTVLYPVYALFQLSRLSERILRQADTQGQRLVRVILHPAQETLGAPQADRPIRRVLDVIQVMPSQQLPQDQAALTVVQSDAQFEIKVLPLPVQRQPLRWLRRLSQAPLKTAITAGVGLVRQMVHTLSTRAVSVPGPRMLPGATSDPMVPVQGIASLMTERRLVLVAADNTSLDILTPEQERCLHQRIIWEVASAQRQRRLTLQARQWRQLVQGPLTVPQVRSQMLPPIRRFRQLMAWYQHSTIVTQLNLFQESRIVPQLAGVGTAPGLSPLSLQSLRQISPFSRGLNRAPQLDCAPRQLPLGPTLARFVQQWMPQLPAAPLDRIDHQLACWETQARVHLPAPGSTAQRLLHPLTRWLRPPAGTSAAVATDTAPSAPTAARIAATVTSARHWWQTALDALLGPAPILMTSGGGGSGPGFPTSEPLQGQPRPLIAGPVQRSWAAWTTYLTPPVAMASVQGQGAASMPPAPPTRPSVSEPTLFTTPSAVAAGGFEIDVDATLIGYETHLLEQILQVLDQLIADLEQQVWSMVQRMWMACKHNWNHVFRSIVLVLVMVSMWWITVLSSPSWAADAKLEAQVLQIIRDHPEVLIESVQDYQNQQQAKQRQAQQAVIQKLQKQPKALIGQSPRRGATTSKNLLLEFSDFQCPFCARAAQEVHDFVDQQSDSVMFVYKHFPLVSIHDQAQPAAQAAWAAQQQGQFWDFHDALFAEQDQLGEDRFVEIAQQLNLDVERFNRDRTSEAAAAAVRRDMALGEKIGVSGTPFFIFNGEILDLPLDFDAIAARL